ncbi:hypothetical protein ABZX60_27905 [Streptomyces olivaceus]|uniref:competence protein CoiA family protein n=1 Tax=Streptomyces olivaceus TaxID=47716 RepID=UPI0033BD436A
MVNNLLWHVEFGLIDIRQADFGRPELQGLRRFLLADTRLPLEKRELQCGGVCRQLGYIEWMYVYERNGQLIAAHQRSSSEQRHHTTESAEHQAYKERTVRVAVEAGHRAETEVRTPDGKVRSDVLIYGTAATPTSFEIQRSHLRADVIRRRNKAAQDHGISAAWHTDDTQMFNRNEVAWTRTDNDLPPRAIRDGKHLLIRGGYRRLEMERCDERRARPCLTKRTGKCGGWHPVSHLQQIAYDDFVRAVAAGDIVQAGVREFRTIFHFWTPTAQLEPYEDSIGKTARVVSARRHPPATAVSDRDPTCHERTRGRPQLVMRPGPCLDWSSRSHWSNTTMPCQYCGHPSNMLDDLRRPTHKVCAEERLPASAPIV